MADLDELIRRQRVLAEFGDFVLDHDDLDEILNEACRLVAGALDTDLAKVVEIERETNTGFIRAGVGWRRGIVGHERIDMSERSSEAYAIEIAEPVITNDLSREDRFDFPAFLHDHGVLALANVPILLPGRKAYGVLQVDAREPRQFDKEDVEFLKTYAMVLGPVVDRLKTVVEREQAQRALSERQERLSRVLDGMGEAFALLAPDFTILEENREGLRLDGRSRDEVVGRSLWDIHPLTRETEVGRLFMQAMAERRPVSLEHRYAWEAGRARWLDMRAYPTADGALAVFWRDVTDRRNIEDSLRESEVRYRSLFESMDQAYAVVEVLKDPADQWSDFRFIDVNPAFTRHTAMPWPVGKTAKELLGDPNPRWAQLYGEALETGRPIRVEEEERTLGRTFDLNIFALHAGHNRVAVLFADVTDRKRAERGLFESEERLRSAIEVGQLGLWDWNVTTGEIHWSDEHFRMEGYTVGEVTPSYEAWASRIHPDDRPGAEAALQKARDQQEEFSQEFRSVHPNGEVHWLYGRGRFFYDDAGQAVRMIGAMTDTTERRQWEETQKVLIAELQHRTRNLIGLVRSVADKTARGSADLSDFRLRFRDRLDGLARVQGLLSRLGEHDRVTFDALIRTELSALDGASDGVTLDGPAGVRLRSSTVQTLAMAVHELATNAVKYGALSQPDAKLHVTWASEASGPDGQPWLHIDWRESGVQMASADAAPRGTGQGRELIEQALPYQLGARTTYALGSDGVHCTISVPVSSHPQVADA